MLDNHVRAMLPRYTTVLVNYYSSFGLTPNHITLLGLLVAALAAICIAIKWYIAAAVIWWIGRLLDGTDGIYARATDQTSRFGAYLDIVCDMAAYSLMLFGFAAAFPNLIIQWFVMMFCYVLCITSALALGVQEQQGEFVPRDDRGLRLGAGLAEGGETGIAYTLFLIFPEQLGWLTWLWIAVLVVTVVARSVLAHQELDR